LAVENDEKLKDALNDILVGMGMTIYWASDALEIAPLLANNQIDIALINMNSVGETSWQIVKEIQARAPQIPILPLTNKDDSIIPEKLQSEGIVDIFNGPINAGDLNRLIRKLKAEKANAR
jgi:DNA-binding NtrC family response regulator